MTAVPCPLAAREMRYPDATFWPLTGDTGRRDQLWPPSSDTKRSLFEKLPPLTFGYSTHNCHSSLPSTVAALAMKLLAEHRDWMKVQVAPPSSVSSISPTGSLEMTSPALPTAIASDGLKLRGSECGVDQVRPAFTLVRTSY